MKNHVTLIGCPKLDMTDYAEKLTEILRLNEIQSVTVVRMEVPCCGGIEHAVKSAVARQRKDDSWQVVTLATDGTILGLRIEGFFVQAPFSAALCALDSNRNKLEFFNSNVTVFIDIIVLDCRLIRASFAKTMRNFSFFLLFDETVI
jgi:hypothetical protein